MANALTKPILDPRAVAVHRGKNWRGAFTPPNGMTWAQFFTEARPEDAPKKDDDRPADE